MQRIEERFEIASPVTAVYDALSQPETIVATLPGVSSIYRFDPAHYRVQAGSAGRAHQLDIEVVERDPGRRLAWRSTDGRWTGSLELQALQADRTLVFMAVHDNRPEQDAAPDNGEAASVIDAAVQHLKTALQAEVSEAMERGADAREAGNGTHISHGGESGRTRFEGSQPPRDETDWRGSQSSFFRGDSPSAFMRMLSREMDRWWEQLQRGAAAARRTVGNLPTGLNPPVEICERGDEVLVCADVPGLQRGNIEVQIDDGLLTIRGERKPEDADAKSMRRSERPYGAFVRRVALPEGLDLAGARAVLRNGVLQVRIPVIRTHRSRTVTVESDTAEPKP